MQNKVQPLSSSAVPAAERSEAERSETERSAAVGTAGADPTATVRPDPEVVAKAKRRRFTAEYKQQTLTKADAAGSETGGIGALLRRLAAVGHRREDAACEWIAGVVGAGLAVVAGRGLTGVARAGVARRGRAADHGGRAGAVVDRDRCSCAQSLQ